MKRSVMQLWLPKDGVRVVIPREMQSVPQGLFTLMLGRLPAQWLRPLQRAVGHGVATAHMADHSMGAALYAQKR